MQTMIGVIGGSGVYQIDGLEGASWVRVKTPWGKPSDEVLVGRVRQDISHPSGINMWIVADNVRKGAATNSVQIAELLVRDYH